MIRPRSSEVDHKGTLGGGGGSSPQFAWGAGGFPDHYRHGHTDLAHPPLKLWGEVGTCTLAPGLARATTAWPGAWTEGPLRKGGPAALPRQLAWSPGSHLVHLFSILGAVTSRW